jgi:cobalamin biosynthesis protein CbiD
VKLKTERKKIKLFGGNTITKWQHGIFFTHLDQALGHCQVLALANVQHMHNLRKSILLA